MKIRLELHLIETSSRCSKPPAAYVVTQAKTRTFCRFLKSVQFSDGFASNLSRNLVEEQRKHYGLKSHDYHILLQCILPIAIRHFLTIILDTLLDLAQFSRNLLHEYWKFKICMGIVLVLFKLERIFPLAFFTIIVHLCVHLLREVILGGSVHSRWMYPAERYLKHLNKMRPQ